MGTVVLEEPNVILDQGGGVALPWRTLLYNDDYHSIGEVVRQVQKATGYSVEKSFEITMEVHTKGIAVCYTGSLDDCERVAQILKEIKLTVEVDRG